MDDETSTPLTPGDPPTTPRPDPRPTRHRRAALAAVTATAVLVTGGAVGFGLGRWQADPASASTGSASAATNGWTRQTPYGLPEQGDGSLPQAPSGGTFPGFPDSAGGTGTTGLDSAQASADQLTGMVRIVSTTDSGEAVGTGMVLTSDGEVVTNHHVVEGATSIQVEVVSTGETYTADLVGSDATADIAVLRLEGASGLDPVVLDDDGLSAGKSVTAVGDGGGESYLSAADGTVLRLRTSITVQDTDGSAARLARVIEIDADVVSGYSGGATLDAEGEVVGMTTAASSGSATITGYAIPVARVERVVDLIETGVESGRISIGYDAFLGVGLADGTGTTLAGVVSGSGAEEAGLAAGDTVTAVDGVTTSTAAQLTAAVQDHAVGDTVSVTWTGASGASHTAQVTLTRAPVA